MKAPLATTLSVVLLSTSAAALSAQQRLSAFDGVWRQVERRVVRPDSTLMLPPLQGVGVVLNGHFSQIYVASAPSGVHPVANGHKPLGEGHVEGRAHDDQVCTAEVERRSPAV